MSPQRAANIIPREAELSAECRTNYFGGAWVIWARLPGYERAVTQFTEPFSAAHWLADYSRLVA